MRKEGKQNVTGWGRWQSYVLWGGKIRRYRIGQMGKLFVTGWKNETLQGGADGKVLYYRVGKLDVTGGRWESCMLQGRKMRRCRVVQMGKFCITGWGN